MDDTVTCERCGAPGVQSVIMTECAAAAEQSASGTYLVYPEDIQRPEYIQISLNCKACEYSRVLNRSEWEVA